MVRFSCFSTNIHYHRSKKEVRQSAESMSKASEDHSHGRLKASGVPSSLAPKSLKESYDKPSSRTMDRDTSFPGDHSLKPGEIHSDSSPEATIVVHQKTGLKKSHSLGSALNRGGRVSDGIDSEDEIDRDFSCDGSDEKNYAGVFDVIDRNVVEETFGCKDPRENFLNKYDNVSSPESFQGNSEVVPSQPIFSIEDTKQLVTGDRDVANPSTHGYAGDSGDRTPDTPSIIAKSCSLPNFDLLQPTSKDGSPSPREGSPSPREGSPCHASVVPRCKSFEDLSAVTEKNKVIENHAVDFPAMEDQERGNGMPANTEDNYEDLSRERYGYESCNYHFGKDWNMSTSDEVERVKEHEGETSIQNLNALPNKDFKIKRIEEWVNMIDLEDNSSLQDMNEAPLSIDKAKKGSYVLGSASTAKLDPKSTHGMEVAKNYVSSLPAASTSAQLASLGLAVIPFLSAFVNLKTLNLSSNAIVRITSGALPRGLHVLNLAKNNISSIEGLRELSRLRVLDLSYNRILRIGHGLASCSSLKELYLAGNKISEVEGLHRLLKLNVLDLRFNKISTAKCLGQLAANYSSLQAVNLEGNPAQRNVGDEQLKKYLQSILPHLVYYNKQTIRASSKEATDRSSRSTIASHQSDRGLRSEHKLIRKGNHIVPAAKASSSSGHAHRSQAASSSKQSKDRLGRLPPSGTKVSHRHHYLELGSKLLGLHSDSSMRRSRSEGNLGEGNLGAS